MRWPWQRDRGVPPVADPGRAAAAPLDGARLDATPLGDVQRAVVQRAADPAGAAADPAAPAAPAESTAGWAFLPPLQRVVQPVALTSRPVAFLADLPTRAPVRFTGAMSHVVDARAPSGIVDPDPGGPPVQRSVDLDLPLLPPAPRADAPVQRRATGGLVGLDGPPAGVPRLRAVPVEPPAPPTDSSPVPVAAPDVLPGSGAGWSADGWAAPDLASDAGGSGATTVPVAPPVAPATREAPVVQRRVGLGAPLPAGQRSTDVRRPAPGPGVPGHAAVPAEPPRSAPGAPLDVARGAGTDAPVQRVVGPASSAVPPTGSPAQQASVQRAAASDAPAAAEQRDAVAPAAPALPSAPDLVLPPTGQRDAPDEARGTDGGGATPDAQRPTSADATAGQLSLPPASPVVQRAVPADAPAVQRPVPADAPVVQRSATTHAAASSTSSPASVPAAAAPDHADPPTAGGGLHTSPTLADTTPLTTPPAPGPDAAPVVSRSAFTDLPLPVPAGPRASDEPLDRAGQGPSAGDPVTAAIPAPDGPTTLGPDGGPVVSRLVGDAPPPVAPSAPVPVLLRDGPLLGGPRVPLTVASTASPAVLRAPAGAARPAVALQRAVPDAPAVATSRSLPSTVSARPLTGAARSSVGSAPGSAPAVTVSRSVAGPGDLSTGAPVTPVPVARSVEAGTAPSLDLASAPRDAAGSLDDVTSPARPAPDVSAGDAAGPGTDDGTPSVALDALDAPPATPLDVVARTAPPGTGTVPDTGAPPVPVTGSTPASATPLVVSRTTSPAPTTTGDGPTSGVAGLARGASTAAPDAGANGTPPVLAQRTTSTPATTAPAAPPAGRSAVPVAAPSPATPAAPRALARPVGLAPPLSLAPPTSLVPVQLMPAHAAPVEPAPVPLAAPASPPAPVQRLTAPAWTSPTVPTTAPGATPRTAAPAAGAPLPLPVPSPTAGLALVQRSAPPTDPASDGPTDGADATAVVQRADDAPTLPAEAPPPPPTAAAEAGAAGAAAGAGASPFATATPADLDELARRLMTPLMRRVRGQLLVDRERRGTRTDR